MFPAGAPPLMQVVTSKRQRGKRMDRPIQQQQKALALIEVLAIAVILIVLSVVVVPQFSTAGQADRANRLANRLRCVRTQLSIFRDTHGVAPGYPGLDPAGTPTEDAFLRQMADPRFRVQWGAMPANPINGKCGVRVVADGRPLPAPDDSTGWIYQPAAMIFKPNCAAADEAGKPFAEY